MGVIEFRAIGGGGFSKNGTVQHFDEALVSFFSVENLPSQHEDVWEGATLSNAWIQSIQRK